MDKNFNPRSPCGERPAHVARGLQRRDISTRAPLAGSDHGAAKPGQNVRNISTRAPLAGSDRYIL